MQKCFSPRNGEIILKFLYSNYGKDYFSRFSPRNGEIILKVNALEKRMASHCFSPRNGEIILKGTP